MIRVIIERHFRPELEAEAVGLLLEMRGRAMRKPGYVSGETLRSLDDPSVWLVISNWMDSGVWREWETSPERRELTGRIESLLTMPEKVSAYSYVR